MNTALNNELKAASTLMQQGQLPRAAAAIANLKSRYDSVSAVWALASEISLRQGKFRNALDEVDRALTLDAHNAKRHAQRARCAILAGLAPEANASVARAIEQGVTDPDDFLLLASVLVRCDDQEGALQMYRQAEAIQPDRNELHRGMATVYRFLGHIDDAEASCDKALAIDPHDYEMLHLRSSLRKQSKDSNHVEELTGLLQNGVKNWRGAVQVSYATAKELEDLEEYEESFKYLSQGASLRRRNTQYDVEDDIKIFTAIKDTFTEDAIRCARGEGNPSSAPIFVLGLPRTGSTLVERIVSSHSSVSTAGELNDFAIELLKLVAADNNGQQPARLELPGASLTVNMDALGKNYIEAAQPRIRGTARFIDKLPLNSLYIGPINLALPNAKVVHVERHPVDACFAMYKYLFKHAYPFSYDLGELATYYIAHHQLMAHWRNVLPAGSIHDVRYEDLVCDQRGTTARLLDYLGLPWEDACLDFHLNAQASTTGSASQVRQRIYASSVGKWRAFEQHLRPLIETLTRAGIAVD